MIIMCVDKKNKTFMYDCVLYKTTACKSAVLLCFSADRRRAAFTLLHGCDVHRAICILNAKGKKMCTRIRSDRINP